MALSPEQEAMWRGMVGEFDDTVSELTPITLKVEDVLGSTGDLYYEIQRNRLAGRISEKQAEDISWFFGAVLDSEFPEAVVAALPYISHTDGSLEVQLVFPASREGYGQA